MPLSHLLAEKNVYKSCPPVKAIVIDEHTQYLPIDWLTRLAQLIHGHIPDPKSGDSPKRTLEVVYGDLVRQNDSMNTASAKQLLQLFYLLMSKTRVISELNFSEQMITDFAIKIDEGLPTCNPGFQNRLFELQKALVRPKNFTERLARYREMLVEKTAISLTDDVHGYNTVFKAAQKYGVNPLNASDPYSGSIDQYRIHPALTETFDAQFTPMQIIDHLETQLQHELTVYHYEGRLDSTGQGYEGDCYEPMMAHLNAIFAVDESYDFWFVLDEDTSIIYDIDWRQIRLSIIEKLYNEELFTQKQLTQNDLNSFTLTDFILYLKNASAEEFERHSVTLAHRIARLQDIKLALQCIETLDWRSSVHHRALNEIFDTIAVGFIGTAADYAMLHALASRVRQAMLYERFVDYFSGFIDDWHNFVAIVKTLNGKQAAALCQKLGNDLPRLVKTKAELSALLVSLHTEHAEILCRSLSYHMPKFIRSGDDCVQLLNQLSRDKHPALIKALEHNLPILVNNMAHGFSLLRYLTTEQTRTLLTNSKELHVIRDIDDIIVIQRKFESELHALFFTRDKQGFNQAIWRASSFTASELPFYRGRYIYQQVDEHSSTLRQMAFHVGRYWTDFVAAESIIHKPLYLVNNHKFFTPYQNVGDAGNKLIKPAAMVLMHCFSCIAQLINLARLLALTTVSILLLPITLLRGYSYSDSNGYLGLTMPLIFRTIIDLVSMNAQILLMLPLAIASVFTRSATTVFSVFSKCLNNSDLLQQDNEAPTTDEAPGFMVSPNRTNA